MTGPDVHDLDAVFAVLRADLSVDTVAVTPTLYTELDQRYAGFKGHTLVAIHEFTRPWGSWEMHPAGDEIVVLLSGQARFRVRTGGGEEQLALSTPGQYLVVPRGCWHTAETTVATRLLFITPGEGTRHDHEPGTSAE